VSDLTFRISISNFGFCFDGVLAGRFSLIFNKIPLQLRRQKVSQRNQRTVNKTSPDSHHDFFNRTRRRPNRKNGGAKVAHAIAGQTGAPVVLESALASDLHEIVCVVRDLEAVRRRISPRVSLDKRLYWLTNHVVNHGQSASVIAGLWAIDPKVTERSFFWVINR
jgi:hypothetical protein